MQKKKKLSGGGAFLVCTGQSWLGGQTRCEERGNKLEVERQKKAVSGCMPTKTFFCLCACGEKGWGRRGWETRGKRGGGEWKKKKISNLRDKKGMLEWECGKRGLFYRTYKAGKKRVWRKPNERKLYLGGGIWNINVETEFLLEKDGGRGGGGRGHAGRRCLSIRFCRRKEGESGSNAKLQIGWK